MNRHARIPAALVLTLALIMLAVSSWGQAQSESTAFPASATAPASVAFAVQTEIARALPRKIVYNAPHEQLAMVDAHTRLVLMNALDYQVQATLYEQGRFGDLAFSHDGRWLAVQVDDAVELWDTGTFLRVARLDRALGTVRELRGPMAFTSDDSVLLFYADYAAPLSLRRSENDFLTYPWLWHLPTARGESESSFRGGVEAIRMVDYPNGFVLTPQDTVVAALPARLQVLDPFTQEILYEIPTERYERDPLTVWSSMYGDSVYVAPASGGLLLKVDTGQRTVVEYLLSMQSADGTTVEGEIIGAAGSRFIIPLLNVLLPGYRDTPAYGNAALTVRLVDLLQPPAATQDNVATLLHVTNEDTGEGRYLLTTGAAQQMVFSPDGAQLLVRTSQSGDETVNTYDLASGAQISQFIPALRGIGGFRRDAKNRVLAYSPDGGTIISDFQRVNRVSGTVVAEDLRFNRAFDRFYFSGDGKSIITLSGSEWREWDALTGDLIRREVFDLRGRIVQTSDDGFRYLILGSVEAGTTVRILDLNNGEDYSLTIPNIPGSPLTDIFTNPSWSRVLAVYRPNEYSPYYPGLQLALFDFEDGQRWLVAGDDLPAGASTGQFGWVDDDTIFVSGQRISDPAPATVSGANEPGLPALNAADGRLQPARIYGVDYAPNGLPACIAERFPDETDAFLRLWERILYHVRADRVHELALRVCATMPSSAAQVESLLEITAVPTSESGISLDQSNLLLDGLPRCLLTQSIDPAYADLWRSLTADATLEQAEQLATLLCEGITSSGLASVPDPSRAVTMLIDATSAERQWSSYQPASVEAPLVIGPVAEWFEEAMGRPLGSAILNPTRDLIAASSLPGELIVYLMPVPYDSLVAPLTATAQAQSTAQNLVFAQPTPSPTAIVVGTPRPTLTVTPQQTLLPEPVALAWNAPQSSRLCPSDSLYAPASAPDYGADGRLMVLFSDGPVWAVEPEDGSRREAPELPQCERGVRCQFSPDHSWIFGETYDQLYVVRPDGSDSRILWDLRTPNPPTPFPRDLYWSGGNTLEWEAQIPVTSEPDRVTWETASMRDILNVYPDPAPWIPEVRINGIPAQVGARQPGGPWAVVSTTYNTGVGPGYRTYLYQSESGEALLFAQTTGAPVSVSWHPLGQRLFYSNAGTGSADQVYTLDMDTLERLRVGNADLSGTWSNDGRYRVNATNYTSYPVAVQDMLTGNVRAYCLPETGDRTVDGPFIWSPDSRYLAMLAALPADEADGGGPHLLILDLETGAVTDLTRGALEILGWADEPGRYGPGDAATLAGPELSTPMPSPIPTTTQAQ